MCLNRISHHWRKWHFSIIRAILLALEVFHLDKLPLNEVAPLNIHSVLVPIEVSQLDTSPLNKVYHKHYLGVNAIAQLAVRGNLNSSNIILSYYNKYEAARTRF